MNSCLPACESPVPLIKKILLKGISLRKSQSSKVEPVGIAGPAGGTERHLTLNFNHLNDRLTPLLKQPS